MKKFLLCGLSFIALAWSSFAQSFTAQHGDTLIINYSASEPDVTIKNLVHNITSNDIQLKWRIINHNLTGTGWTFSGFCDNITCYTSQNLLNGMTNVTDMIPANTDIADFHAIINGANAPNNSIGFLQIEATDQAAHYSKVLTFAVMKGNVNSISTTTKNPESGVTLFPIPAKDQLNVVFEPGSDVKSVSIYNLIGKPVTTFKVNGSSAVLDVNNIPSGIYFVRLMDTRGRVIATRKFTKQ